MQFSAHPWHGVPSHAKSPELVTTFIEIVPTDTVKYEIDKHSGILMIDRPQLYSNIIPSLYGFIPRTYCGTKIAALASSRTGVTITEGDHDPLDICVLTEKNISHGNILVHARPIGGITLIDKGEADDKIIAVLDKDHVYSQYTDIAQLPQSVMKRIAHYFLTYKNLPDEPSVCTLSKSYGRDDAYRTILTAIEDYKDNFV